MSVYAVSDLHGQYDAFSEGIDRIGLKDTDMLYVLGDAVDRGEGGIEILQYVMGHENMDLIIGNHEFMMLNSVDPAGKNKCSGADTDLWLYYNGGRITFEKYIGLKEKDRIALLEWLRDRYVIKTINVGGKDFCLTHSYYVQKYENKKYHELEYARIWNIVWTSVYRHGETKGSDIYKKYDYTFITGHVPVGYIMQNFLGDYEYNDLKIYKKGNFIDIDGGCSMGYCSEMKTGALFIRLDDMKVFAVPLKKK